MKFLSSQLFAAYGISLEVVKATPLPVCLRVPFYLTVVLLVVGFYDPSDYFIQRQF